MKKLFVFLIAVVGFSIFIFGEGWIGGGLDGQFWNYNITAFEGRLTYDFPTFSIDAIGQMSMLNSINTLQIGFYLNYYYLIQVLEFYFGIGIVPTDLYYNNSNGTPQFAFDFLTTENIHAGFAFDTKPIRIYSDITVSYPNLSPYLSVGAQAGF